MATEDGDALVTDAYWLGGTEHTSDHSAGAMSPDAMPAHPRMLLLNWTSWTSSTMCSQGYDP